MNQKQSINFTRPSESAKLIISKLLFEVAELHQMIRSKKVEPEMTLKNYVSM